MSHDAPVSRAMFVDEVDITVTAGKGGDGCVAFRREKFIPKGGPNGGDGGDGGNVLLRADEQLNTLHHLAGKHHWKARKGQQGLGKTCHGKRGEDCVVPVPPGTLIFDADHGTLLKDLAQPGEDVVVARGGRGGRGNTAFKSPTNQAPRQFEPGEPGQERRLHLELKLIADVGLVGLPNAGKSTLLSRLSAARPKIAAYPFTTLTPNLGIVELSNFRRFVLADIPGLIEGAHTGAGLGDEFLRHIERTTLLVHVVDIAPLEGDPVHDYEVICRELEEYSPKLAKKPRLVVANKTDLTGAAENLDALRAAVGGPVLSISAVTGDGLDALSEKIWAELHPADYTDAR